VRHINTVLVSLLVHGTLGKGAVLSTLGCLCILPQATTCTKHFCCLCWPPREKEYKSEKA